MHKKGIAEIMKIVKIIIICLLGLIFISCDGGITLNGNVFEIENGKSGIFLDNKEIVTDSLKPLSNVKFSLYYAGRKQSDTTKIDSKFGTYLSDSLGIISFCTIVPPYFPYLLLEAEKNGYKSERLFFKNKMEHTAIILMNKK
jgi:hypothetical protein